MNNPFDALFAQLQALESKIDALPGQMIAQPTEKVLLTRKEAMALLNIRDNKLCDLTRDGIFTAYRIGTRIMYKRAELLESLEQMAA